MSTDYDTLLLPLFQELRRAGAPLGLPEYLLAIETLREGVGLEDAARFQRICRLLWTKSREDQVTFDRAFAELVWLRLQPIRQAIISSNETETAVTSESPVTADSSSHFSESEVTKEDFVEEREGGYYVSSPLTSPAPTPPPLEKRFHYTPRLPISMRVMAERWRRLRRFQREGSDEELDIDKTISDICRLGVFRGPVLQPRASNQTALLLLVDQRGSMAPFSLLIDALLKSLSLGELKDTYTAYYFHNCPDLELYGEPHLSTPHSLEQVLVKHAMHSRVLIVSDAGAARTYYDETRLEATRTFLKTLRQYTYLFAWLNPMPAYRWLFTTAENIAELVPMFPLDKQGLDDTISVLQGRLARQGVS